MYTACRFLSGRDRNYEKFLVDNDSLLGDRMSVARNSIDPHPDELVANECRLCEKKFAPLAAAYIHLSYGQKCSDHGANIKKIEFES